MKEFWWHCKAFGLGMKVGFMWYIGQIKQSKWYIVPFVIDMLLLPLKAIILLPLCQTKWFQNTEFYKSCVDEIFY